MENRMVSRRSVALALAATSFFSCQGDSDVTAPLPTPGLSPARWPAPAGLKVVGTGTSHITWGWNDYGDSTYDVRRWLDSNAPSVETFHNGSQAFYRWDGLAPGTTAYLRVRLNGRSHGLWSEAVKGVTDSE